MVGRKIGPYQIEAELASGGRSPVYRGYDPTIDRLFCIKVLPKHLSQDPFARKRFLINARACSKLKHENILPISAWGEDNDIVFIATPFLKSRNLAETIRGTELSLGDIARILKQIGAALDYAHQHQVLHLSIKPTNILLDVELKTYLTDFGISKLLMTDVLFNEGIKSSMFAYMSPEQLRGAGDIGPESDIYSLGAILFECLTGRRPYQADKFTGMFQQAMSEPAPSVRKYRPDLPGDLEQVMHKAIARNPASRFESACALADAFTNCL